MMLHWAVGWQQTGPFISLGKALWGSVLIDCFSCDSGSALIDCKPMEYGLGTRCSCSSMLAKKVRFYSAMDYCAGPALNKKGWSQVP